MTNKNSSVGITEDIITNIMHLGAGEYHLEILVRKYEDQIKFWYNIDAPEIQTEEDKIAIFDTKEKLNQIVMTLQQLTEQRRKAMAILKAQANDNGNPDLWCLLKHVLVAVITSFEAWQVDIANDNVKSVFIEQSRVANQVLAMFLGYEVTPCSACLTDQLKEDGK
jgi:hypothetical protein|nr:MAG TPA: hypothetical protein [Caudoviricetes sp.]